MGKDLLVLIKDIITNQLFFDDVKDNFTIMKEEPFGPLVPILTFKTFDEVIERANDNDLGLCSYLYTNSMDKAHIGSEN